MLAGYRSITTGRAGRVSEITARARGLAACHLCCQLTDATHSRCPRCGARIHLRKPHSLQRTLALLLTASLLYIPANIYPIMHTVQLGQAQSSTILGGVLVLIDMGSLPVALIIFLFSVVVPIGKMLALYYLVWTVHRRSALGARQHTQLYKLTELVGKWSMVDVFVVAILAALVHVGELLVIEPGIAALSFAGVVIFTMLAAEAFDVRLVWDVAERPQGGESAVNAVREQGPSSAAA